MVEFLALAITAFSLGVGSIIALRLKIPPLIVFLAMGMIVGSYGLLQQNSTITFIGDLGSALLLFSIGTEFSIYKLIHTGFLNETKVALSETIFSFSLLLIILQFWFSIPVALLLALAFSITSTGISLKLLQELNLNKKFDIPLIIKISVIEDLIAVMIFTIISSFSILKGQPLTAIVSSFFISLILFVVAYYAFLVFFNKFLFKFNIKEEDLLMLALGVLLLMVSISDLLGLSTSFGAYISGSIVSTWKDRWKDIDHDLRNFSYIFISFFFLAIGLQVSLNNIDFLLLALMIPIILVIKFAGVFIGSYSVYKSSRTSMLTSFGMLSRGELSLVLVSAAVGSGLLAQSFLGFTAILVLSTVLVSFVLLRKSVDIYTFFRLKVPRSIMD